MSRLWFDIIKGKIAGVLSLTDEQALDQLERGRDIRPVGGASPALVAQLTKENAS